MSKIATTTAYTETTTMSLKKTTIIHQNDKKMKEPPMLLVKKDVLYCDRIANGTFSVCFGETSAFPGPNSGRHVQDCNATTGQQGIVCDTIDETTLNLVVSDNIEFPGSEEGTKVNLNGERYTITEKVDNVQMNLVGSAQSECNESGYDDGIVVNTGVQNNIVFVCVLFEGDCSGIIQDGEIKECTVKNYVQSVSATS